MVFWKKWCHGALEEKSYVMVLWERTLTSWYFKRRDVMVLWEKICHGALGEVMSWCFGKRDVMVLWKKSLMSCCFGRRILRHGNLREETSLYFKRRDVTLLWEKNLTSRRFGRRDVMVLWKKSLMSQCFGRRILRRDASEEDMSRCLERGGATPWCLRSQDPSFCDAVKTGNHGKTTLSLSIIPRRNNTRKRHLRQWRAYYLR